LNGNHAVLPQKTGTAPREVRWLARPLTRKYLLQATVFWRMCSTGVSTYKFDHVAVAGSLDHLAVIPSGKLAIIAGNEISTSNAASETVLRTDALGAPGSSWPAHIPFPTAHPLRMDNLPARAIEIAQSCTPMAQSSRSAASR
jgi:hypothetical protein